MEILATGHYDIYLSNALHLKGRGLLLPPGSVCSAGAFPTNIWLFAQPFPTHEHQCYLLPAPSHLPPLGPLDSWWLPSVLGGPTGPFPKPARSWRQGTYSPGLCSALLANGFNWLVPKIGWDTRVCMWLLLLKLLGMQLQEYML